MVPSPVGSEYLCCGFVESGGIICICIASRKKDSKGHTVDWRSRDVLKDCSTLPTAPKPHKDLGLVAMYQQLELKKV
ncbi:hypothetical protein NECAME_01069 [Necator americanus]|uniref:Uncharacterized protein n=1 Tax=Necator americanus TaxID=51031 RepID=W2SMM5_NECAM|nr:hypothetical protein NECAME_01069 [Necator americanus]ETN70121.1 hypothetical protein NECAME_01069 [Necator americanus]